MHRERLWRMWFFDYHTSEVNGKDSNNAKNKIRDNVKMWKII